MLDKLNFYDLLGYLIPGGTVYLLIYFVGVPVVTGQIPSLRSGDLPDLGSSIGGGLVLVAVSYAFGHLVQSVGEWWEKRGNDRRGGRISEQMLVSHDDPTFSDAIRHMIRTKGEREFGLPPYPPDAVLLNARLRELFELCYSRMIQCSHESRTDLYLAISGLSRGLVVAAWLGMLLGATVLARELIFLGSMNKSDISTFGLALAAIAFSFLVWRLAEYHYFKFRVYFARSVWFDFLVTVEAASTEPTA